MPVQVRKVSKYKIVRTVRELQQDKDNAMIARIEIGRRGLQAKSTYPCTSNMSTFIEPALGYSTACYALFQIFLIYNASHSPVVETRSPYQELRPLPTLQAPHPPLLQPIRQSNHRQIRPNNDQMRITEGKLLRWIKRRGSGIIPRREHGDIVHRSEHRCG